jgi:hypothetical protein
LGYTSTHLIEAPQEAHAPSVAVGCGLLIPLHNLEVILSDTEALLIKLP